MKKRILFIHFICLTLSGLIILYLITLNTKIRTFGNLDKNYALLNHHLAMNKNLFTGNIEVHLKDTLKNQHHSNSAAQAEEDKNRFPIGLIQN